MMKRLYRAFSQSFASNRWTRNNISCLRWNHSNITQQQLLTPALSGALEQMGIRSLTPMQQETMRLYESTQDSRRYPILLGEQPGRGKTIAFLLGAIKRLQAVEMNQSVTHRLSRTWKKQTPFAIVVSPSRELAEQTFRVAKLFSHHAKFRVRLFSTGSDREVCRVHYSR